MVAELVRAKVADVRLLARDPAALSAMQLPSSWRVVRGDLADPDMWRDSLLGVDRILHLASATGKVPRATYRNVIVRGTERLLSAAQSAGVARMLFVSSVAAGFPDRRHYHYAEAKRDAEALVLASGLDSLVVRPTMVFGAGSAVFAGMQKLATLPVPLVFGSGELSVQPIHVDDLAALLRVALMSWTPWRGQVVTVGGAEAVTTDELLRRIRALVPSRAAGAADARLLHIPIEPLRTVLALLEPLMLSALPFTAGQLASFANAGAAGAEPEILQQWRAALAAPRRSLDDMLRASAAASQGV